VQNACAERTCYHLKMNYFSSFVLGVLGGLSCEYFLRHQAPTGRPDIAAKIYHNPSDEHAAKLAAMLAAPPGPLPQPGQHFALAWPISRLLEPGEDSRVVGYLMPRIDKAHLIWEIYNPGLRREICPHFHHGLLLRTARNLAVVVHSLHECGYVVGDLNESNVLVTPQASVTLIDVDSFQVPGRDRLYRPRQLDQCPWCGPSSANSPSRSAVCYTEVREQDVEKIRRKVVNDPLPPRGIETDVIVAPRSPAGGGVELVMQAIGMALEQSNWLVWLGVALIGAVVGVIYALQHALSG